MGGCELQHACTQHGLEAKAAVHVMQVGPTHYTEARTQTLIGAADIPRPARPHARSPQVHAGRPTPLCLIPTQPLLHKTGAHTLLGGDWKAQPHTLPLNDAGCLAPVCQPFLT